MFFVLLGLTVVAFPLHFNARGSIDMYTHEGTIRGYFFVFRVFTLRLRYSKDDYGNSAIYIIDTKRSKIVGRVHLNADTSDKNSIANYMVQPIFGNINITDIELYSKIGRVDDAFLTAMSISFFRSLYCAFMSVAKSWQSLRTYESFTPVYNKNIFEIQFLGIFTFNIADIMYGLIKKLMRK